MQDRTITIPLHRRRGLTLRAVGGEGQYGETKFKVSHTFGLGGGSFFIEVEGEPYYEIQVADVVKAIFEDREDVVPSGLQVRVVTCICRCGCKRVLDFDWGRVHSLCPGCDYLALDADVQHGS